MIFLDFWKVLFIQLLGGIFNFQTFQFSNFTKVLFHSTFGWYILKYYDVFTLLSGFYSKTTNRDFLKQVFLTSL